MTIFSLLSFAAAMLILAMTPGPGVFAVLSRALSSGFRKSLFLIAGIVTGDLMYLAFALSGLTWMARNVGGFFTVIRILGGLYLISLGLRTFLAKPVDKAGTAAGADRSSTACYTEGLIITLSNPKVILFYYSFLPAFINLSELSLADIVSVALIVGSTLSLVMTAYSLLAVKAAEKMHSSVSMKILNKSAGGLMVAAGSVMVGTA